MGDEAAEAREPPPDTAFFITQVGPAGSHVRRRTDDVERFILEPALDAEDLTLIRADKDATPGRISDRIVQSILDARLVVADVTGANPNVYYELGVAHACQKPVILLIDRTDAIPFDTKDQHHIIIGDEGTLGAAAAENARMAFAHALSAVLEPGFEPTSPVAAAITRAEIAKDGDPQSSALADMQRQLDELRRLVRSSQIRVGGLQHSYFGDTSWTGSGSLMGSGGSMMGGGGAMMGGGGMVRALISDVEDAFGSLPPGTFLNPEGDLVLPDDHELTSADLAALAQVASEFELTIRAGSEVLYLPPGTM